MKKGLREFLHSTIFMYSIVYSLIILVVSSPRILAEIGVNVTRLAESFTLPLDIISWGLFGVCFIYAGVDLAALKNIDMVASGNIKIDDPKRVLNVIKLLSAVAMESVILNFFFPNDAIVVSEYGRQVFKGLNLPLNGIISAIVTMVLVYAPNDIGEKNEKDNSNINDNSSSS